LTADNQIYVIQRTQGGTLKVAYRKLSDACLNMEWKNRRAGRRVVRVVPVVLKD